MKLIQIGNEIDKQQEKIYKIVLKFRIAIEFARDNNLFSPKDRMSRFPCGCCDDFCDLLAKYLKDKYRLDSKQVVGFMYDICTNHVLLNLIDDNLIIDITGDQFGDRPKVFVGHCAEYDKRFKFERFQKNYDICNPNNNNNRLLND